jgi:hypothetical protein
MKRVISDTLALELEPSNQTTRFFTEGREVFTTIVLEWLAFTMDCFDLVEIRLVCKEWSLWITRVKHLNINRNKVDHGLEDYRNVTSIKTCACTLVNPISLYKKIISLEVDAPLFTRHIFPNYKWHLFKSIEKLILLDSFYCWGDYDDENDYDENDDNDGNGIHKLKTLKELTCYDKSFRLERQLYLLTNLTHLTITGFSRDKKIVENLPLLSFLESDQLNHFLSFSGFGVLHIDMKPLLSQEEWDELERMCEERGYDFHAATTFQFSVKGWWENGVLVGVNHVKLRVHNPDRAGYLFYDDVYVSQHDESDVTRVNTGERYFYIGNADRKHYWKDYVEVDDVVVLTL